MVSHGLPWHPPLPLCLPSCCQLQRCCFHLIMHWQYLLRGNYGSGTNPAHVRVIRRFIVDELTGGLCIGKRSYARSHPDSAQWTGFGSTQSHYLSCPGKPVV